MKAKHFFSALVLLCGMVILTGSKPAPRIGNDTKVRIGMTGLNYGSMDVTIRHNGETYYFSSSTAIQIIPGFLGEFDFTGDSFEVELTLRHTPALTRITTSANLVIEEISTLKYRVTRYYDPIDLYKGGEIGIHFD